MSDVRRVAVLENGVKINTILVDDVVLASGTYDPGYGDTLVDEGPELFPIQIAPPPNPRKPPTVVAVDLKGQLFNTGDALDLSTGIITPAAPDATPPAPVAAEIVQEQLQELNDLLTGLQPAITKAITDSQTVLTTTPLQPAPLQIAPGS